MAAGNEQNQNTQKNCLNLPFSDFNSTDLFSVCHGEGGDCYLDLCGRLKLYNCLAFRVCVSSDASLQGNQHIHPSQESNENTNKYQSIVVIKVGHMLLKFNLKSAIVFLIRQFKIYCNKISQIIIVLCEKTSLETLLRLFVLFEK